MRKRLMVDGSLENVLRTIIPPELMKVGAEPYEWLEYIDKAQDYYTGTNQITALAEAKLNSGQESASDLLRMAGPIVRDICAGMEMPMSEVLDIEKYQILQFFDTNRVMNYVGPDGVTAETFDFDPTAIVPSHMAGEDPENPSKFSRMERAKNFARNLRGTPTPGYLHGMPKEQQKLLLLQGWRAGFPIDPGRVAKVYGIENWEISDFPKWKEFKQAELEFAAQMAIEGQSLQPVQPGAAAPGAGGGGIPPNSVNRGGRPPGFTKPPAAVTKGSAEGPRITTTTS